MFRSTPRTLLLALAAALVLAFLALPVQAADSWDADSWDVAPTATVPDTADGLFAPKAQEKLTSPKEGPCTMSYQCSPACGGRFISCSGEDYCQMGSEPGQFTCTQNVYVQCDDQEPVYCVGSLTLG